MSDADLQRAAWHVLSFAWGLQWALIVGVGSLPKWAVPLCRRLSWHRLARKVVRYERVFALLAVALCLQSIGLVMDTYRLEAGEPYSVQETCQVTSTHLACESGQAPLSLLAQPSAQEQVVAHKLRYSGRYFAATRN